MQDRVFRPADIEINRQPFFYFVFGREFLFILRIGEPEKIPAGTDERVHRIEFTFCFSLALRTSRVYKIQIRPQW